MPDLDLQSSVDSATRTMRTYFLKSLAEPPDSSHMRCALVGAPSDGHSHDWSWIGDLRDVEEWADERTLSRLREFSYQITNKRWENTVGVPLMAFRTKNKPLVIARVDDLVGSYRTHLFKLMSDLLVNGTTDTCFTGSAFFANDHSYAASGAFDNLLAGAGTSLANLKTDWAAAKAAMRQFPNAQGNPINAFPDVMWVPAELEGIARELAKATTISSTSNIYAGEFIVVVDPRLTDANDWYALCTHRGSAKPFIHQVNQGWEFKAVTNVGDSYVFLNDEVLYGGDGFYQMGYGLPQMVTKVVNT